MKALSSHRSAAVVLFCFVAACGVKLSFSFSPSVSRRASFAHGTTFLSSPTRTKSSFAATGQHKMLKLKSYGSRSVSLRMSSDDFNESKYTEAAWSTLATLTKAADYYEASTIEAPILVDVLFNPAKHNAGDNAESAKRVAERILQSSGASVKELRSELEKFLAKQPKISSSAQKMSGRTLQKVLESARENQKILGVCLNHLRQVEIITCFTDVSFLSSCRIPLSLPRLSYWLWLRTTHCFCKKH
jgi:hypothetical protein